MILFGLGILITPLIWYGEGLYLKLLRIDMNASLTLLNIIFVYGGIAVIEELAKFFSAYFILKRNKYFDEAIDAMIYLIVLALGFGLVENILAASQEIVNGSLLLPVFQTMSLRFVGANLLHALSSGIIGFFWALFLLKKKKSNQLYWGLVLGIALHFFFNLAIIKFGGTAVFLVSLGLFFVTIGLLWAFDLLKQIKKPIKYSIN
jgi:RsiW-degrading membrane proteinase PrsW (M82 family)